MLGAATALAALSCISSGGDNQCMTHPSVFLNNTDYSDGSGPRTAANATDCCNQCINEPNCMFWDFNVDDVSAWPSFKRGNERCSTAPTAALMRSSWPSHLLAEDCCEASNAASCSVVIPAESCAASSESVYPFTAAYARPSALSPMITLGLPCKRYVLFVPAHPASPRTFL
jgi:hypothetical protein